MRQATHHSSELTDAGDVALAVVRSLPDAAVFVVDHDLRFRFACGPVLERLGWDVGSLIGREAGEVLPDDAFAQYEPHLRNALAGTRSELENDAIEAVAVLHNQFSPLRDGSGEIVGALVVSRDVTDRWAAEAARRQTLVERDEARSQFETAFADAPIGMALVGLDGAWLKVNAALCEILGWPAAELLESSFADIAGLSEPESDVAAINDLVSGDVAHCQLEKRCRTQSGGHNWVLLSMSLVRDRSGAPGHVIVQAQDIGGRRRLAEELAHARDEALELSRLKSEYVANMSHEIRTPLNGVLGLADVLLDSELNEDQREFVQAIRASGDALMGVISDILDVSKIEAGKLEIDEEDFELRRIIDEACAIVAPAAGDKDLELMAWVDHDLPQAFRGDGNRVRQVLVNLLNNAVKFTDRGEVVVRVRSRWREGRPVVRFEVRDSGIGIEPAALDGLFEAFTQVKPAGGAPREGTGLGLSISRQLVELMGGHIGAHSAPGRGSTFWFSVPLAEAHGAGGSTSHVDLAGVHVLVADDNATNRTILRHQLAAWNMTCDCVDDGAAARRLLRVAAREDRPYALVLLDRNMPGMHDLELVHDMKGSPELAGVPILILSSTPAGRDALRRSGVDGVLTKPVGHARLRDEIKRILGTSVSHQPSCAPARPAWVRALAGAGESRRRAARPLGQRPPMPAEAPPRAVPGDAPRVLLAEDNEVNQMVAVNVLERCGYAVDLAQTGREAVEMSMRERYQAIFMDCRLPELDGYSAAAEIRRLEATDRHTPIIAITAHTMRGDREKCLAAGMDEYIAKPLRREALESVLERTLSTAGCARRVEAPALAAVGATASTEAHGPASVAAVSPLTVAVETSEPVAIEASAPTILDTSLISEIDPASAARIVALFIGGSRERVAELGAAVADDDTAAVRRLTHSLKGAAASVGAVALCRACDRLAAAASAGDADRSREAHLELERVLARTESVLAPRSRAVWR